jgi:hypothetical protein
MEKLGNEAQFDTAFSALKEHFGSKKLLKTIFKDKTTLQKRLRKNNLSTMNQDIFLTAVKQLN